jgi:hypothetical protein
MVHALLKTGHDGSVLWQGSQWVLPCGINTLGTVHGPPLHDRQMHVHGTGVQFARHVRGRWRLLGS